MNAATFSLSYKGPKTLDLTLLIMHLDRLSLLDPACLVSIHVFQIPHPSLQLSKYPDDDLTDHN